MNKGKTDSKILLVGVIVTVLVLGILAYRKISKPTMQSPIDQLKPTNETNQEIVSENEPAIEEGLFLDVTSPADGTTVSDSTLVVSGKTESNAEVFVNESELTADLQGNFSTTITLEEGENVVVITVSDDDGNFAEREVTITYEP